VLLCQDGKLDSKRGIACVHLYTCIHRCTAEYGSARCDTPSASPQAPPAAPDAMLVPTGGRYVGLSASRSLHSLQEEPAEAPGSPAVGPGGAPPREGMALSGNAASLPLLNGYGKQGGSGGSGGQLGAQLDQVRRLLQRECQIRSQRLGDSCALGVLKVLRSPGAPCA